MVGSCIRHRTISGHLSLLVVPKLSSIITNLRAVEVSLEGPDHRVPYVAVGSVLPIVAFVFLTLVRGALKILHCPFFAFP